MGKKTPYLLPWVLLALPAMELNAANLLSEIAGSYIYADFVKQQPAMAHTLSDLSAGLEGLEEIDRLTFTSPMKQKILVHNSADTTATVYTYTFERPLSLDEQGSLEEAAEGPSFQAQRPADGLLFKREVITIIIERTQTINEITGYPHAYLALRNDEISVKLNRIPADPELASFEQSIGSNMLNVVSYPTHSREGKIEEESKNTQLFIENMENYITRQQNPTHQNATHSTFTRMVTQLHSKYLKGKNQLRASGAHAYVGRAKNQFGRLLQLAAQP